MYKIYEKMNQLENKIFDTLSPQLHKMGYEMVYCSYNIQNNSGNLKIFIDRPEGISVQDCTTVMNFASALIEAEDLLESRCSVEVSSPGDNRPLLKPEHFTRFIGREAKIKLNDERHSFQGEIKAVHNEQLELLIDSKISIININDIDKATLMRTKTTRRH